MDESSENKSVLHACADLEKNQVLLQISYGSYQPARSAIMIFCISDGETKLQVFPTQICSHNQRALEALHHIE